MTNKKNFNALVAGAIAAVLVLGGFILWQLGNNARPADTTTSQTTDQPVKQPASRSATAQDPNSGYVLIQEWGLRFKPTNQAMTTVQYVVGTQKSQPNENITFTTKALADYGTACTGKLDGDAPLGILTRTKSPKNEFTAKSGAFVKRIGDYYYQYITPQSSCSAEESVQRQQTELTADFKQSIATLEQAQ